MGEEDCYFSQLQVLSSSTLLEYFKVSMFFNIFLLQYMMAWFKIQVIINPFVTAIFFCTVTYSYVLIIFVTCFPEK